ncbi:uncharacterized protein [Rutidosis leptorrhynchoides]|uniref:uncharacterized protein n=1 Tax=Rutidosis leptorrhynchoides TaxID=125765 RepID=UPI003A995BB7
MLTAVVGRDIHWSLLMNILDTLGNFLKQKSEAGDEIISFIKRMENPTLEKLCADKGISQNFSAVRTPQENGVAERRNETLIEVARSIYSNMSKVNKDYNKRRGFFEESINVTFDETDPTLSSSQEDEKLLFEEPTQQALNDDEEPHRFTGSEGSQFCTGSTDEVQQSHTNVHTTVPTDVHDAIIGNLASGVKIRRHTTSNFCMHVNFVSTIEPTSPEEALKDPSWEGAMQVELSHFDRNKLWILVPKTDDDEKKIIGTKNKARLVAQGFRQEEGLDYGKTYAPVARMEAIRIFLAFATHMNFKVFQMDVKSAFLNGKLQEKSISNNLLVL